jgi:L-fuculose-phosphate aldolase
MVNEWKLKEEICEIGRRVYAKGFAAANDGNISCRVSDNEVLCTPTLVCKGFLKPDDICTVDLQGNQLSGRKKRTSEILLHLEVYKADPNVKAIVHCHPPHATAFSVAGQQIPTCILPEVEVFLGVVPTAVYETPGGKHFAETILPYISKANTIVLKNHGTISWGESLERAYWWTEILDAYCRILILAKQIGGVERISEPKVNELLDLKERFGMGVDARRLENADLCVNTEFGRGFKDQAYGCLPAAPTPMTPPPSAGVTAPRTTGADAERMVQLITDQVMAALGA